MGWAARANPRAHEARLGLIKAKAKPALQIHAVPYLLATMSKLMGFTQKPEKARSAEVLANDQRAQQQGKAS